MLIEIIVIVLQTILLNNYKSTCWFLRYTCTIIVSISLVTWHTLCLVMHTSASALVLCLHNGVFLVCTNYLEHNLTITTIKRDTDICGRTKKTFKWKRNNNYMYFALAYFVVCKKSRCSIHAKFSSHAKIKLNPSFQLKTKNIFFT